MPLIYHPFVNAIETFAKDWQEALAADAAENAGNASPSASASASCTSCASCNNSSHCQSGCQKRSRGCKKSAKNRTPADWLESAVTAIFDGNLAPAVDVYNLPESYLIVASVAGARPSEVKVHYDPSEHEVVIKGKFSSHTTEDNAQYLVVNERSFGDFERKVKFNKDQQVDSEAISAKFVNGVLKITVPKVKPEPVEKTSVEVAVEDSDDDVYQEATRAEPAKVDSIEEETPQVD